MAFRLTEQERAIVLLWRAFLAYQNERDAAHRLLDDPSDADEESCRISLYPDGSGEIRVDPGDPNQREFVTAPWFDLPLAARKVDAAAATIRTRRELYEAGQPRFGNPQRGRAKEMRAPNVAPRSNPA
jgi:hypothetical protein